MGSIGSVDLGFHLGRRVALVLSARYSYIPEAGIVLSEETTYDLEVQSSRVTSSKFSLQPLLAVLRCYFTLWENIALTT